MEKSKEGYREKSVVYVAVVDPSGSSDSDSIKGVVKDHSNEKAESTGNNPG